ncbi:TniB family NTP-binding protein [Sulfitobacter sp.]|uniref:TniB family NTP-binding protein n=1 Tax=Sulfitobacter sp. TaxID=1903071 RepID=UPI0040588975
MTNTIPHLTTGATALLAEPTAERIRAMRSRRWVLYPRAKQALDRLDTLLQHPRGTRMCLTSALMGPNSVI